MAVVRTIDLDRRKPESCVLNEYERSVYSQNGEDGILERIFEIIGDGEKWCVEFGAWDGIHLSNTCNLIKNHGWHGVLIEGNPKRFDALERNFVDRPDVHPINAIVGFDRTTDALDTVLQDTPMPENFDLLSIDIDGNDYFIWQSLRRYTPRVVVIEFNPTVPNDVVFIQDKDMMIHQGCSLAALVELGKRKDYELVAVTNCNGIFVQSSLFLKFEIADNSVSAMRKNVPGRIFHGYDGTIYNHMLPFYWAGNGRRIEKDELQVLDPEDRKFYDSVEDNV